MISANKLKTVLLFIFILMIEASAQTSAADQFNYAKKLFDEEKYFDAVTEFKRLLFFDKSDKYLFEANKFIGLSYKSGGKFSEALTYLTLTEINSKTKDDFFNSRIEIIKVNILRRTTSRALSLLDSLNNDYSFTDKKDEINYWLGWAYIFSDDWENASLSFSKINENHELKLLADSVSNELYNKTLAKILSVIIPGAGQIYTGEYFSGLLSFGWNVLWGYLTVQSFVDDRIFDGVMTGSFLWMRFYNGNLQNAEKFAEEKNLIVTNNALRYLQKEYSGNKP